MSAMWGLPAVAAAAASDATTLSSILVPSAVGSLAGSRAREGLTYSLARTRRNGKRAKGRRKAGARLVPAVASARSSAGR